MKSPQITRRQRKIIDAAAAIRSAPAASHEKMFLAHQLVQATLPHRDPGNVPVWSRRSGDVYLEIQQGYRYGKPCGYPYGTIPRLLIYWMTTEAVRTKKRTLQLGDRLSEFVREIGLSNNTGGGPRGDPRRLKAQMNSLFSASISFTRRLNSPEGHGQHDTMFRVARETMFWWSRDDEATDDPDLLWGSYVVLDQDFFDAITARPVPVDLRALRALKQSPLALDLYSLLTYHAFLSQKYRRPRMLPWRHLLSALGANYRDSGNFNDAVREELSGISAVYPALRFEVRAEGIEVLPESMPAVPRPFGSRLLL